MPFVREGPITILTQTTKPVLDRTTGRYSEAVYKEVTHSGNLQPTLGEDLDKLPDGYRVRDSKTMFLHVDLQEDDVVLYRGERYHVEHTDIWDPAFSTIPHYRYLIYKEMAVD